MRKSTIKQSKKKNKKTRHVDEPTMEPVSSKIPLLLFSGGLDSTFMLQQSLMESDVDILYVDGGQAPLKIQAEELARLDILDWFIEVKKKNPTRFHSVRGQRHFNSPNFAGAPGALTSQPVSWLIAALYHCDPERHSCVRVAYVMGDDMAGFRHELCKAWDALLMVTKLHFVPIEFPLIFIKKPQLLREIDQELIPMTWTCETPVWLKKTLVPCGKCVPCKRSDIEQADHRAILALHAKLSDD